MKSNFYILIGILLATVGLKGFLIPNHFIDGGVTGVSMLIAEFSHIKLEIILLIINLPFVGLAVYHMGWRFAIRSTVGILGLAAALYFITIPHLTNERVLSAIFGGLCLGAGIGLAFRGGAVLDGTDVLAIITSKKTGFNVSDIILIFNSILFGVSIFLLGIDRALFSILTYLSASKAIDLMVFGFQLLGVFIISSQHKKINERIQTELNVGTTLLMASSGKLKQSQQVIYSVCSKLELSKMKALVEEEDQYAFFTVHKLASTFGGTYQNIFSRMNHF